MDGYLLFLAELDMWCNLTFTLLRQSQQRLYKNITVKDDDLVNPWRSIHLKVLSANYQVEVAENSTHAVVWVEDNEGIHK